MSKRPFISFILVISILVGAILWFIQSPQFAWALKAVAYRYLPKDLGVQGDFSELSVQFYPPGFSVKNPKLLLGERNIVKMPAGSSISAERIDFNFRLFQIFSGDIRVHEVRVVRGDLQLVLDPAHASKSKTTQLDFHWDELLQVKADAVGLEETSISVRFKGTDQSIAVHAKNFRLSQWEGHGGLGYHLVLNLDQVRRTQLTQLGLPELPLVIEKVGAEVFLNALGTRLDSFFVAAPGLELSASGEVKGNVLNPLSLPAELSIQAKGDIANLLRAIPSLSLNTIPIGEFTVNGKLQGDLMNPKETLQASGEFLGKAVSYKNWQADQVGVEAKWNASPSGGELILQKAVIASSERPRVGGFQPGWGGKVEVGPARWVIGSSLPVRVPLRLERAHINWLVAGSMKNVYPMDFRASGLIEGTLIPKNKLGTWELQAELGLKIEPFQLDNQRYLKTKPLSTLFKVPQLTVTGPAIVNSTEFRANNVVIKMPNTQLNATGKINFKTGFDLYGLGPLSLNDLGTLSDNKVRGQGVVAVHVHGPASAVLIDIDADFKDAYYLNLALGNFKGRISWDDGVDYLKFDQVQLTRNFTHCTLNGGLDIHADTVDLKTLVTEGNIQDLFEIFGYMTRTLDWFPRDLTGAVKGDILVSGGLAFSKLKVLTHLSGTDWERWGERFKTVDLIGGYDRGKYFLSEFKALKKKGKVSANLTYNVDQQLSWDLQTQDFGVGDLDHIAQLDVPIRGKLALHSTGKGMEGSISSSTELSLTEFSVRGTPMPPSKLVWKTGHGISRIQATAMGGQGVLKLNYDFDPKELSTFHLELRQLDFTPALLLLNPKSIQDKALRGSVSGIADFDFHSGQFERASGLFLISQYLLARSDIRFSLASPVSVEVFGGAFAFKDLTLKGRSGDVSLNLESKGGLLEGAIRGALDTAIVEFFTSTIVQASGTTSLDLAIGGALKQPTVFGSAKLEGGSIRISSLDSPFENIIGSLQLRQNIITVQGLRADLGGGGVSADGSIVLYADRYPEIDLKGKLSSSKVKVYPFQVAQLKGNVRVHGDKIPYRVDGQIDVESALCKEKVLSAKQGGAGLKALPYAPPLRKSEETNSSKFVLAIKVNAERGILIQNDLFKDVEAKGNMTLVNTLDSPKVVGTAEVIQGKLLFKDHVFQIQHATAHFDNPNVINPSFDLNANTEVNGIKIQLFASGRMEKINKIEFVSNPAMAESEILSLLAVGLTATDAKKLSSSDQNVVQQGEVTSLLLHSLDFNRDFEDKTGFQVQLDESMNPQQGASAFRPQSQLDVSVAPQITIRKKLGDRLSLSAGSTVGAGSAKSNQVNLDFSVSHDVSISGVFANYGTTGTADAQQNTPYSTGMDLKFQERFK